MLLKMVEFEHFVEEVSVQCGLCGSEATSQGLQLNLQVLRGPMHVCELVARTVFVFIIEMCQSEQMGKSFHFTNHGLYMQMWRNGSQV